MNIRRKISNGQKGFSLVELMIVVAIIGILAALAVPKFNLFQAKARQAEAKSNLSHIYTLQQSYFGDNDTYIAFAGVQGPAACTTVAAANTLGFTPSPCNKLRYAYSSTAPGAPAATTFTATGTAPLSRIYPGCAAGADTWTINQLKDLQNPGTGLATCGGN